MIQPTEQDKRNAAYRAEVAARFQVEYDQCAAWAHEIMDKGWLPVGRHFLIDKQDEDDCRRTGKRPVAAATCYSVSNGVRRRHFIVRDGKPVEVADYKEAFGSMLAEPHPTMRIEIKGEMVAPGRYSLCWAPIETYEPQTADELAAAREKREAKALQAEADASPLFSQQILAEGRKPRGRH